MHTISMSCRLQQSIKEDVGHMSHSKVQVGNGQEKAHSEKDSHSKNRGGKN